MEEMVPELEDLEKRGFFSAAELKQIAAKRTDFEYLLKRRAPLKADYLRWASLVTCAVGVGDVKPAATVIAGAEMGPHRHQATNHSAGPLSAPAVHEEHTPGNVRGPQTLEHAAAGTSSTSSRWSRCA
jgi:U3 small nucleolar RNA-associated protein 6